MKVEAMPNVNSQPGDSGRTFDASRLNLSWLLKLRWVAIFGQAVAIAVAELGMDIELPVSLLLGILGIEIASNLVCLTWSRRASVTEGFLAALMALDVVLLTLLLHWTGGPFNPFSTLYLVHIALAAATLRARFTWMLSGLSFVAFGSLFILQPADQMRHHADHMRMHLQGMWVALGIAALFIAYFVTRIRRDLEQRELELARARTAALQSEKLASLATLAAGAAHELASPLSTIAVAASELLSELETKQINATDDVQLIRREVERCRGILNQMALDAGQSAGESFERVTARQLVMEATEGFAAERFSLQLDASADHPLYLPRRAVGQALRAVLKNAVDATTSESPTTITARDLGTTCQLVVDDRGSGMQPEVLSRAGEPFFTTKDPGAGMGLGLFLSRTVLERLGGALRIDSRLGQGTRVQLDIPRDNLSH